MPADEELLAQYQKRTEKTLHKVFVGVAIMCVVIIVGAFFV